MFSAACQVFYWTDLCAWSDLPRGDTLLSSSVLQPQRNESLIVLQCWDLAMDFSFINTVYWVDDNGSGKPVKIKQLFVPLAVIAVAMAIVFLICMYCRALCLRKMYFENRKMLRAKQLETAETQAMLAMLKRDIRAALLEKRTGIDAAQRSAPSALQRVTTNVLQRVTSSVTLSYYTSRMVEIFDQNRDNSLSKAELDDGLQELGILFWLGNAALHSRTWP